jgi:hypothetical protein
MALVSPSLFRLSPESTSKTTTATITIATITNAAATTSTTTNKVITQHFPVNMLLLQDFNTIAKEKSVM